MAHIVVMGGGLNGLTAGILLARDGHQVTITERDPASPRGNAGDLWQRWDRRGVNQFRQVHFMLPRWRAEMERELPEVIAGLEALGGVRTSMLGALPDEMTGGKRDGDERFETVTGRRPVLEAAIAAVARRTDGLTVCRGVAVTGLVTGAETIAGVPHVAGVTVGGATELHADLVIDATGRRSPAAGLLGAIGARRPDEEKQDCGFVYYARHFRSADGSCPEARERLLQHFEGVSILTRAGPAGQGDLPRLDRAPLPRPGPQSARTPSAALTWPRLTWPRSPGRAHLAAPRPRAAQRTQVAAAGRAASRSAPMGCPHRSHTPYRPSASRRSAASTAATCSRAAASSAAACCRSNASVAPSGSCSSSVPAALAASASPANSRSSAATPSRARARSTSSTSCASTPRI